MKNLTLRISDDELEKLDYMVQEYQKKVGIEVTRSSMIRLCIDNAFHTIFEKK